MQDAPTALSKTGTVSLAFRRTEILDRVIDYMETYDISPYDEVTGKGLIRHIFTRYGYHTGEIMVCIVATAPGFRNSRSW